MKNPSPYVAILAGVLAAGVALAPAAALAQKPKSGDPAKQPKDKDAKKPKKDGKDKKPKSKPQGSPGPSGTNPPSPSPAPAPAAPGGGPPIKLDLLIQKVKLDNGLRVVLNVDKTSPTVAVSVLYDVGSRNEVRGRSGFAHLFEHMMFQGSANVPKGDHFKLISGHGGVLNGTTSQDRTNYFETLPANELALALWLEADRMKSLAVTAENFENQRKVVQDEYRMRVSNVPYVPSEIRLEEMVFQGYWPYEHSTIGSMADLDGAKLDWVQEFFRQHYGPNNAVLAIAGDVDADEAMALVHRYFDKIPQIDVAKYDEEPFPEQTSQRTAVMKDAFARTPGVLYGWPLPPVRSPDHYALELAATLLGDGESSRLHQLVVRDKALAQGISATTEDRRGPDMFVIDAKLADGAKVGDVEKLIEGELKALTTKAPSDAEMEKARRRAQASLVLGLQSNLSRANRLGQYEAFFGDARLLNTELPHYLAVTKEDVKRVATQYLGPTRRTIVETYPADQAAPAKSATGAPASADKPAAAQKPSADGAAKKGEDAPKHPAKKKAPADTAKKSDGAKKPASGKKKKP